MRLMRLAPSRISPIACWMSRTATADPRLEGPELLGDEVEVADHVGQRVVDLVADARGQRPQRGEPVGQRLPRGAGPLALHDAEHAGDLFLQDFPGEGLLEEVVGVDRLGLGGGVGGDGDDGDVGPHLGAPLLHPELPAVHDRQPQVEHDQIGQRTLGQRLDGLPAVAGGADLVPFVGQQVGDLLAQRLVVLHHQDAASGGGLPGRQGLWSAGSRGGASLAVVRGSVTVKVAPRPGSLLTSMAPPWARTIWPAMYRPRPRPP